LTWASALRQRGRNTDGTSLLALHVPPTRADNSAAVQRVEQEVDIVRQHFASLAGVALRQAVDASDSPSDVILKYCDSEHVDLVVLGTRAERSPDGSLLGSVSSAVVARASAPVLLVPPGLWRTSAREPLP
jgi:nucleotide-binding universal stress UspA family protein